MYGSRNNTSQTSRIAMPQKNLIYEGFNVVGKMILLADMKISSLVEPSDGVWLWVWCAQ